MLVVETNSFGGIRLSRNIFIARSGKPFLLVEDSHFSGSHLLLVQTIPFSGNYSFQWKPFFLVEAILFIVSTFSSGEAITS